MLSWDLRRQVSSAPKEVFAMPSKMTLDRAASVRPRPQNSPVRRLPPYQPVFPKILQKPRKCATLFLTNAIRARGPAAARHFATNENRLPILPISPNHAQRTAALPAQLCRIRPLAELPPKPFFRTSQIVSDRLRSSEIVRAHRRPSPAIPAELPKGSPDSVRQTGKKARQNASNRVVSRQNKPRRARGNTQCSICSDHTEIQSTWHDRICTQTVKKWPSTTTRSAAPSVGRNFFSG